MKELFMTKDFTLSAQECILLSTLLSGHRKILEDCQQCGLHLEEDILSVDDLLDRLDVIKNFVN